jgi:tetratricopeptide (TPR) repeat protein
MILLHLMLRTNAADEATYENALKYFLEADLLKDHFVSNALWCGHTYRKLGKNQEAKNWYQRAAEMRLTSTSDRAAAREASKLIAKL